jgi:ATP-binding cassette, subfamily B, bacterial
MKAFWMHHIGFMVSFVLLSGGTGLSTFLSAYWMKCVIDDYTIHHHVAGYTILAFLSNEISRTVLWRLLDYIRFKKIPALKKTLMFYLRKVAHQQATYYHEGALANYMSTLLDACEQHTYTVAYLISAVTLLGCSCIGVSFIHPWFGLGLMVWSFLFFGISRLLAPWIQRLSGQYSASQAAILADITDSLQNHHAIRDIQQECLKLQHALHHVNRIFLKKEWFLWRCYGVQGLLINTLMGGVLYGLTRSSALTPGDFALLIGVTLQLSEQVWWSTELLDMLYDAMGKIKQSWSVLTANTAHVLTQTLHVLHGGITWQEVSVHFATRSTPALITVSYVIKPQQLIVIVGPSGSGKTTLLNTLIREHSLSNGHILIDGQCIARVTQASLNAHISLCKQYPRVFQRTILENLTYGCTFEPSFEEVQNIAKKVNLHQFIMALPQQYQTLTHDLSIGQLKCLLLARTWLHDSAIVLLDDPMASLDSVTTRCISTLLLAWKTVKTMVVVTHHTPIVHIADAVLVLEQGHLVASGHYLDIQPYIDPYIN